MTMLFRRKRLEEGTYNVKIVEIKSHISKNNDEGIIIKFKTQGNEVVHTTRLSMKANFLMDKLADVLCGEYEEISYEMCSGRTCIFDIKIYGDFINLVDISKLEDIAIEDEDYESKHIFSNDIDDIYENYEFPDFEDEDFDNFDEEEDLV